jgi:predicted DNA-binding transcriptional regulator AlpA
MRKRLDSLPAIQVERAAEAPTADPYASRLTLRLDELAAALGVSRRSIERERSAGRFPRPDVQFGRSPLWRVETIRQWLGGGDR